MNLKDLQLVTDLAERIARIDQLQAEHWPSVSLRRQSGEIVYFRALFREPASTFEPVLREERASLLHSLKELGVTGEEIDALEPRCDHGIPLDHDCPRCSIEETVKLHPGCLFF
jgi:hypothetical protein